MQKFGKRKWKWQHTSLLCIGIVSILIAFVLILYSNLINYGWQQLQGQYTIIRGAKSLSYFLNDSLYTKKWQEKIRLVQEIKKFSTDSLGLDTAKTYNSLYLPPQGEEVPKMWVVTATEAYALRPYTWYFPIVGSFPYKGFFNHSLAKKEESILQKEGYDTEIDKASGWSTLGWIENPLLPGMLRREPGRLADLLLHELTHNTIHLRNKADFNENLASFVGTEGAKAFLRYRYGDSSQKYLQYVAYVSDHERYYRQAVQAAHLLDSLYISFSPLLSLTEKKMQKKQKITALWASFDSICFKSESWQNRRPQHSRLLPNNTFFMSYLRYRGKSDSLKQRFQKHKGTLRSFIESIKQK